MKVMRRSRWLARLTATLVVGVAALVAVASAPAQAGIVFQSHVVASWGDGFDGDLGNGTTDIRPQYGDLRFANDVVQVAAGYYFGLALRSDGTVWAWGDNGSGQLGDSTKTDRSTPGRVLGPDGVVTQVAAGAMSLALRSDGTVWAWGGNDRGQLGNGTTVSTLTPFKVTGLSHVTSIAAGYNSAVATATNGISAVTSCGPGAPTTTGSSATGRSPTTRSPSGYLGSAPATSPTSPPACGPARSWAPTARSGVGATTAPGSWPGHPPARR
jgi:alpha-tubulin suppressor-like RCC1 family protein